MCQPERSENSRFIEGDSKKNGSKSMNQGKITDLPN
jgi:hypothetical protein